MKKDDGNRKFVNNQKSVTDETACPEDQTWGDEGDTDTVTSDDARRVQEEELARQELGDAGEKVSEEELSRQGLIDKLAIAREENETLRDRLLRIAADMENMRRRNDKEVEDARSFGIGSLLRDLLPAMDSIDRAEENLSQAEKDSPVGQGLKLIHHQFVDALAKYGVVGFDSVGQTFDPARHEAMATEVSDQYPQGTVIKQWQKGYFIKERLFRPAMVIVSAGPSTT